MNTRRIALITLVVVSGLVLGPRPSLTHADSWGAATHRGANVGLWPTTADLKVLRSWGADHVRVQLLAKNMPVAEEGGEATFTAEAWERLDAFLERARTADLRVVLDLHQQGTFFTGGNWRRGAQAEWDDAARRKRLVQVWRSVARRYVDDREVILAYDLLNEPVPPYTDAGYAAWNQVAVEVSKAVREVDQHHTIVVECASYANPGGMVKLKRLTDANVVYSFHMYLPHELTEQGTRTQWPFGQRYPGEVGLGWDTKTPTKVDRTWLEESLKPVDDFAKRTGARVWVGEFSVRRDAPNGSALRYLSDVLELFEARGWSWAYHAFRESAIWDLERCSDGACAKRHEMTPRLSLLHKYWAGLQGN